MTKLGLFFVTLFGLLLLFALAPVSAYAGGKKDTACGPECQAWQSGKGAPVGKKTDCVVTITAPTFGGKIALDVRDANRDTRWRDKNGNPAPRIKTGVPPGIFSVNVGCGWLEPPTAEVYMCAEGPDGKQYSSILWRSKGQLDKALTTHRLDLCLKGEECPDFVPGPPPPH